MTQREKDLSRKQYKECQQIKEELDSSKRELIKRYFTDHLTQLPNHYKLRDELEQNKDFTFIVIHIDNFKMLNDFYGCIVGDYLLEQLSLTLQTLVKDKKLYKMNGADFALVLEPKKSLLSLKRYLKELSEILKNIKYTYQNNDIYLDITLGSSVSSNLESTFSKVSMALRYAQKMRLEYWIYEDRMHFKREYENNLLITIKIRRAIEKSGIVPYFQAIISNDTGKIERYECLARLIDEENKILSPEQFLSISKKIKAYAQVTRSIVAKSFEVFKNQPYSFSINISTDDIMDRDTYRYIIKTLKNSNIGHRVIFEIVESEDIQSYRKTSEFIIDVRKYGAKIAIDDFGSGFSNFYNLTKINIDYLKIDGSLIRNITTDVQSEIVVETIIDFAKKLGIKTVAEYVHSADVQAKVITMGIDYSQGYYICEPKDALADEGSVL